jgi:hypothetical protein
MSARTVARTGLGVVLGLAVLGTPALAYLHFGPGTQGLSVAWRWRSFPIRYYVGVRTIPNVSAAEFANVIQNAFAGWRDISTSTDVQATFAGFTDAVPRTGTLHPLIGFETQAPGINGITYILANVETGEIVSADIGINNQQPWTISPTGEAGRLDLRGTVTHEIGHLLGVAHSQLGETQLVGGGRRVLAAETVMFPISFSFGSSARGLRADDGAGLAVLYPPAGFAERAGRVTGRVTRGGRGVFGAHVVAFDPATTKLVGAFTLTTEGHFTIAGLDPGPKILRVEPLDDAAVASYFTRPVAAVDASFRVTFYPERVMVPPGGDAGPLSIEVTAP